MDADTSERQRAIPWILSILGLAALARLVQFAAGSSLHLDEAALARNIVDRPLSGLIGQSLDYDQVAPAGYLALQKGLTLLLGASDWALRLLPLLAALGLIVVFYRLARRFLQGFQLAAACLVLALAYSFLAHAATAKQYSTDMFAAAALVALALHLRERTFQPRASRLTALAGAPLILLSLPAVPLATCLGAWLLWSWWRQPERPGRMGLLTVLGTWSAAAGVAAIGALKGISPATRAYMHDFWQYGFVPWGGSIDELLLWLPRRLVSVLDILLFPYAPSHWAELTLLWVVTGLCILGAISLLRRQTTEALALLAPLITAIGMAAIHQMPFADRTGLYTAPSLVLLAIEGAAGLGRLVGGRKYPRLVAVAATLAATACVTPVLLQPPPWTWQHLRPVLEQVRDDADQRGTSVYAFYGAGQSVAWYAPRIGLDAWVQGNCHRGDVRAYLRELDRFRGGEVWVVFTHAREHFDEVEPILAYLRTIGTETAHLPDPDGNRDAEAAFAHRFDLSDPERASATTAETFADIGGFVGDPSELCSGPAANF